MRRVVLARKCPRCGKVYKESDARFCEVDGATLEPSQAQTLGRPHRRAFLFALIVLLAAAAGGSLLIFHSFFFRAIPLVAKGTLGTDAKPRGAPAGPKGSTTPPPSPSPAETPVPEAHVPVDGVSLQAADLLKTCYEGFEPPSSGRKGDAGTVFDLGAGLLRSGEDLAAGVILEKPSAEEERKIGLDMAAEFRKKYADDADQSSQKRAGQVGKAVARPAAIEGIEYRFTVSDEKNVNAHMLPGGQVFLFRGLLDLLGDDSELAFVLGHEIAHAKLGHVNRTLGVAKTGGEMAGELGKSIAELTYSFLRMPYDQMDEVDADRLGICLTHLAGFNPEGAVSALERIEASNESESGESDPATIILVEYLSTHPVAKKRVELVKAWAEFLQKKRNN